MCTPPHTYIWSGPTGWEPWHRGARGTLVTFRCSSLALQLHLWFLHPLRWHLQMHCRALGCEKGLWGGWQPGFQAHHIDVCRRFGQTAWICPVPATGYSGNSQFLAGGGLYSFFVFSFCLLGFITLCFPSALPCSQLEHLRVNVCLYMSCSCPFGGGSVHLKQETMFVF